MSRRWNRTIYVGNLPGDIRMREVEDLFYKVSKILFSYNENFRFLCFGLQFLIGADVLSSFAVRTHCGHRFEDPTETSWLCLCRGIYDYRWLKKLLGGFKIVDFSDQKVCN